MRPNLLEVSGFTAFRDPVTVDFRGADLFALTGPTGSGKSSLIDAIVFSLYGSVPRIGQREVAPIVSLGKLEARVRFEFSLDDTDYTVARVVRRTKSGASTAEARLERDGEVLAGTADEVTEAVEQLLGLGFDHFTKSVVLPQGRFAAFLHDRPADRQKLLRELLDLGVYERMRELAKQRRMQAETTVQVLQTQLDELAFATPEAGREVEERLLSIQALQAEVDAAEPKLRSLRDRIDDSAKSSAAARASITELKRVKVPDGIDELAVQLAEVRQAAVLAEDEAAAARESMEKAEKARHALPGGAEIERVVSLYRTLETEKAALKDLTAGQETATQEAASAAEALKVAGQAVEEARRKREGARRIHAAHALTATLETGKDCPVCRQTVRDLPTEQPLPPALAEAEAALDAAMMAEEAARRTDDTVARRLTTAEARLADIATRVSSLEKDLGDAPALGEILRTKEEILVAEESLKDARAAAGGTAQAATSARQKLKAIEGETAAARRQFDEARDRVAGLQPPVPDRVDLADDWKQLATWAGGMLARLSKELAASEQLITDSQHELTELERTLTSHIEEEGYEIAGRPIRDVVVAASTAATHELTRIREAVQKVGESRAVMADSTEQAELAKSLGRHLSATGFEAWLMEEALATLVAGANLLLGELADGAYSLDVVKRDFRVIDHRNANEPRLVKTLSGGETFLVSLALALSLAEQLASMSVRGGGRLESLFLDEGFGSLDVETLDTVAHVIQELGARGRTVGIVTHVRELAEQVPVRFEIRKGAGTAIVERVEL